MNYLASPPLVVAYALAGTMDIDLANEPLGEDTEGNPVYLRDIWPNSAEIQDVIASAIGATGVQRRDYADVFAGDERWQSLPTPTGDTFAWDDDSTYVRKPPYFEGMAAGADARSSTSPAPGCWPSWATRSPPTTSRRPARSRPTPPPARTSPSTACRASDFNSYGSRRGNHEVMIRGTFANIRLRNQLVPGRRGRLHRQPPHRRADLASTTPRWPTRPPASRWSSWPARSTAPARRATGRPRAPCCSASGRSSPSRTSASTART